MSNLNLVKEFHRTFGHPVAEQLTTLSPDYAKLRMRLLLEEVGEFCESMGVKLEYSLTPIEGAVQNLVEAADALGDIEYVTHGASIAMGIPSAEIFAEIHSSNMSKLGADGKPIWDAGGKVMKGPNYRKPDIRRVLEIHTGFKG